MKDANERLDAGAKVARRAEAALRKVAADARSGADEACDVGEHLLAAQLRQVASRFEQAAALAGDGYAIGRLIRCEMPGGGVIQPTSGKD